MRKSDLINQISEKTGIPKVDVLVTLETMFKEVKESLSNGQNIYIRGFGSFITKKRAAKIGRNIKKNIAVEIPEHFIPAFKPAKEFVNEVTSKRKYLTLQKSFCIEKTTANTHLVRATTI